MAQSAWSEAMPLPPSVTTRRSVVRALTSTLSDLVAVVAPISPESYSFTAPVAYTLELGLSLVVYFGSTR